MAEINIEELEQLLRRMGNQGPAGEDSIKELIKVMTRLSKTGIGSDDFAHTSCAYLHLVVLIVP